MNYKKCKVDKYHGINHFYAMIFYCGTNNSNTCVVKIAALKKIRISDNINKDSSSIRSISYYQNNMK